MEANTTDPWTSLWEARRANRSRWQVYAEAWKILAATSPSPFLDWWTQSAPATLSGKMYPVYCPAQEDGTLAPLSGRWLNSGIVEDGECWTLRCSDSPSDARECSLSDVLQPPSEVRARFYLSAKACAGILRRAEKRGKALPPALEEALRSRTLSTDEEPLDASTPKARP